MDEIDWAFYRHYADSGVWWHTQWLGTTVCKCPLDMWVYQEILFRTQPDVVIETGTFLGGGALFLASMCEQLGKGRVITVDIEERDDRPVHPGIHYMTGSSIDPEVVDRVKAEVGDTDRVMVILDSDHRKEHVLGELEAYGPMVTEDCYLIVEDTTAGTVFPELWGPGPSGAIEEFMTSNQSFVIDYTCEKFRMTFNPGGYLKRTA